MLAVSDYGLHHVELVCTDTSGHDNNPFDGVGNTHIEVYINPYANDASRGYLVAEYTKGSGGYADNYIALGGYHYADCAQEWDNLTVTQTDVVNEMNQWAGAAIGNWSDETKWTLGTPAGGQGDVARFQAKSEANTTVNVTSPVTVGYLVFDNTYSYTIQSSNSSAIQSQSTIEARWEMPRSASLAAVTPFRRP